MDIKYNESFFIDPAPAILSSCASDDFRCMALGTNANGIWISHDYGNTWFKGLDGQAWYAICCSRNFKYIIAVTQSGIGDIWTSSNYGLSFSKTYANIGNSCFSICCSDDGQYVKTLGQGGYLMVSNNYGSSWSTFLGPKNWFAICCNGDATKSIATINGGYIYISTTNRGQTFSDWTVNISLGSFMWRDICCSNDFNYIAIINITNNLLYISTNSGSSWSTVSTTYLPNVSSYNTINCSADFKYLAIGRNNGICYYSYDYGTTWQTLVNTVRNWSGFTLINNNFILGSTTTEHVKIGKIGKDSSLYKFNNIDITNLYDLTKQTLVLPYFSSGYQVVVEEIPIFYDRPIYQFLLNSGSTTTWVNPISTGLDNGSYLDRRGNTTNPISYVNYSSINPQPTFPITVNNPSQVIYFNNSAYYSLGANQTLTNQTYFQSGVIEYFTNISLSFWIKPNNVTKPNTYISLINITNGNSNGCFEILINSTGKLCMVVNNDFFATIPGSTTISTTSWSHIVCSIDINKNKCSLYLNGELHITQYAWQLNIYSILLIGMRYGFNDITNNASGTPTSGYISYNGYFFGLDIFNRSLTQHEVSYLYNNPYTDISNCDSISKVFKGTANSNISYTIPGGGIPLLRCEEAIGDSIYSYANLFMPFKLSNNITYTKVAPFYTFYGNSGLTHWHTLKPLTNKVFVIALGGGGGGGGGNFYNGGQSGGGGGGGSGGGLAWAGFKVGSGITKFKLKVGLYGSGGMSDYTVATSGYWCGGNGNDGEDSIVSYNIIDENNTAYDVPVIIGRGGKGSRHFNNPNTDNYQYKVTQASQQTIGGQMTIGGTGNVYTNTLCQILHSGTKNGSDGGNGTGQPASGTSTALAGAGGLSSLVSLENDILINSQSFIKNVYLNTYSSYARQFINSDGSNMINISYSQTIDFHSNSISNQYFGFGGNGGVGEGRSTNLAQPGSNGGGGFIWIFEYYDPNI